MAYIINKTNGSTLTIINDFSVDNTSSPLILVGKGHKDWGEIINENFVKLLENFANITPPSNPLNGQLWYDTSSNELKIYNSNIATWYPIQINYENINFYSQFFVSPTSGQASGFINDTNIVGLFSDIKVSADKLDNGTIFPSVNAQIEFSNGLGPGLNLSNLLSNVYGQSNLNLGVMISNSAYNVLEIDNNFNTVLKNNLTVGNDLFVNGSSEFRGVKVSGVDVLRPSFFLPTSAGIGGQILITQGNNNYLKWENPENVLLNDRLVGHENGTDNVYVYASVISLGIEFYTKNTFRMILDENGNLGLDTNSPLYKLELRPNVSSNNVSIGLLNDNPLIDTSLDIVNEFNSGNSANVNFVRRGNLGLMQPDVGETIGSINWYGMNNQLYDQDVAKIRSVLTTAYPTSTIGGNIEFLTTDISGILQKRFEINDAGELVIYYNDGSNYYILPSSAGQTGQYLVSNSANGRLKWENIKNYEVLITSFSLAGKTSARFSDLESNSTYVIYLKNFSFNATGGSSNLRFRFFYDGTGGNTNLVGFSVLYSGLEVTSKSTTAGNIVYHPGNPGWNMLSASSIYNGKIYVKLNATKKAFVCGEIFNEDASFFFHFRGKSDFVFPSYDNVSGLSIHYDVDSSFIFTAGSGKMYKIINPQPLFTI